MQFQTWIWCGNEASVILTSLRAFSNFGLLSSTLSLDCCFNFRSIAVTEKNKAEGKKSQLEVLQMYDRVIVKYIQSL